MLVYSGAMLCYLTSVYSLIGISPGKVGSEVSEGVAGKGTLSTDSTGAATLAFFRVLTCVWMPLIKDVLLSVREDLDDCEC